MTLDRQTIEKKDFPIGRRGYEPDAVDAHLRELAEQVEELKTSSRRRTETLAAAASEQVQAIVEAAETAASKIQTDAEREAKEIRREARSEAKRTNDEASAQAAQYLSRVSEATAAMLQRVEAMDQELSGVVESLRMAGTRLGADLQLLEGTLGDVKGAVSPAEERFEKHEERGGEDVFGETDEEKGYEASREAEPEPAEVKAAFGDGGEDGGDDVEGARLIALNMALNGSSREEVDQYLAENFQLADRGALVDEVYSSVES